MRRGLTVCVPAWDSAAFIGETLAHLAAQELRDFEVLISIDGGHAATLEACRPWLGDPRFRVILQPQRLGWVANTNALIAAVETECFALMPHDDLAEPGWLAALDDRLRRSPRAACSYSDVALFGDRSGEHAQPETSGPRLERLLDTLLHGLNCVAFRSIVRRRSSTDRPLLPSGLPGDVAADSAWLMELAARGDLLRVARPLVRKRYHAANTHPRWSSLPEALLNEAGAALLHTMRAIARRSVAGDVRANQLIETASLTRLFGASATLMTASRPIPVRAVSDAYLRLAGPAMPPMASAELLVASPEARQLRWRLEDPACPSRLAAAEAALADSALAEQAAALRAIAASVARLERSMPGTVLRRVIRSGKRMLARSMPWPGATP